MGWDRGKSKIGPGLTNITWSNVVWGVKGGRKSVAGRSVAGSQLSTLEIALFDSWQTYELSLVVQMEKIVKKQSQ